MKLRRSFNFMSAALIAGIATLSIGAGVANAQSKATNHPDGIIYESEFQRLWDQNGERWLNEDDEISAKLKELEAKNGKKPNIILILWDDMRMGAVGSRLYTDISGYEAPNLERMAKEGMTFTRMYTEPSCTPTRVAAATGRLAVRSGMIFPIFPIHRMGLPASEVTIAEVVGDTYHTGMFEKLHFGDQEESYAHNQGWDEAIFSLYN